MHQGPDIGGEKDGGKNVPSNDPIKTYPWVFTKNFKHKGNK